MNYFDVVKTRTSYRGVFKNTPVPRTDLKQIMQAGLLAPTGGNKQTTSLIAVDDTSILEKLRPIIPGGRTAPAMIFVLTQETEPYKGKTFHVQDYSAAIENILLGAIALGYQSCWIEGDVITNESIGLQTAKILNFPDDYILVAALPIGCADDELNYVPKKAFEERAWFNGFQKHE